MSAISRFVRRGLFWAAAACIEVGGAMVFGETGTRAQYAVLSARDHVAPPFTMVDFVVGPQAKAGTQRARWWQMEIRTNQDRSAPPVCIVRALSSKSPLDSGDDSLRFERYLVRIPEANETLEYRDRQQNRALLPIWAEFERYFLPHRASSSDRLKPGVHADKLADGMPATCDLLGHVLALTGVDKNAVWEPWPDAKVLELDPELLVGTSRNFRDAEGHRLPQSPQRQNYNYVEFQESEYPVMIEAGINLFVVNARQEAWVRAKPAFYTRRPTGQESVRYPADLYRANYLGPVMFVDEPTSILSGDGEVRGKVRSFSDVAELIARRTHFEYESDGSYGAYLMDRTLRQAGVNVGDFHIRQEDFPCWETFYETAFYQFAGGARGFVDEGRYQLPKFDAEVAKLAGQPKIHTSEELLRYHYAYMRGAARRFERGWGTAIYGQCDPSIAKRAVTLAYDMGARYVWFWTSDHDHHVPWPEQLELARRLKEHSRDHGRRPVGIPMTNPKLDVAITLPNGYFVSLNDAWLGRLFSPEVKEKLLREHQLIAQRLLKQVEECFVRDWDFDIVVDDGRPIHGYRRVVRIELK